MAQIANREKIERILERIAYQVAENCCHRKKIIFVGIQESGYVLAQEIVRYLAPLLKIETDVISLEIDKKILKQVKSNFPKHLRPKIPRLF